MASSDNEADGGWLPLEQRPEWADVRPMPPSVEPARGIVSIAYSEQFASISAYLRAVRTSGERSSRVLSLTTEAIRANGAAYTVWQHRRDVLAALATEQPALLADEMSWIDAQVIATPKNYQLWNHRRWLAEALSDRGGLDELAFTARVLATSDEKNYHAWAHRQWALGRFGLWQHPSEEAFTAKLLARDVRNNSAWNQRAAAALAGAPRPSAEEIEATLEALARVPHNEAAWSYLRSLLQMDPRAWTRATQFAAAVVTGDPTCVPALALLAEATRVQAPALAARLYNALTALDPMRARHWGAEALGSAGSG